MSQNHSTIAIYATHVAAEEAIKELQRSGFEIRKLSIIGQDFHSSEHVVGFYNLDDRMKAWGRAGAFWGGVWGCLFGSALFLIPGLGSLVVAGPLVGWIVGMVEGAVVVGGLSIVGAALYNLGIPKDSIIKYEAALKTGKFILLAHGPLFEANLAREILHRTLPENLELHEHGAAELCELEKH